MRVYFTFLLVGLWSMAFAQDPLYSYEFDGSLGDWEVKSIDCNGQSSDKAAWVWSEKANAEDGAYSGPVGIASPSADNGAALFNSDYLDTDGTTGNFGNGPCPSPQKAELISPTMDFSGESNVHLSFYQYHRKFRGYADGDTTAIYVGVSNDDGATWELLGLNGDQFANRASDRDQVVTMDLTDKFAGKDKCKVKFFWSGDYYFWLVDDVKLYNTKGTDIAIAEWFYPVATYITPESQIPYDTMAFSTTVANFGDVLVDSVRVVASILELKESGIDTKFADTVYVVDLKVGDSTRVEFPNRFTPNLPQGSDYYVRYSAAAVDSDKYEENLNPSNNVELERFIVSDVTWATTDGGRDQFFRLGADVDYSVCNIFQTNPNFDSPLKIKEVKFQAANEQTFADRVVRVYIVDFTKSFREDFDASAYLDNDKTIVGLGNYAFSEDDDGIRDDFVVSVVDFEEGEGDVVLAPNKVYGVVVEYKGQANDIYQGFSGRFNMPGVSTMIWADRWYGAGFGPTINALISMELEIDVTSVEKNPLDLNKISIYPNPANQVVTVDLALEARGDVDVILADINGRIVQWQKERNFKEGKLRFDVGDLASGTYVIRLVSPEGNITKRIAVTK